MNIIEMATKAGLCCQSNGFVDWVDAGPCLHEMTEFAKLVAAHEREECAKMCDALAARDRFSNYYRFAANAIRARGNEE